MDAETLVLKRKPPNVSRGLNLDEVWPVHRAGVWPEDLSLTREEIYEDRT